jgi:hypothetical protein
VNFLVSTFYDFPSLDENLITLLDVLPASLVVSLLYTVLYPSPYLDSAAHFLNDRDQEVRPLGLV